MTDQNKGEKQAAELARALKLWTDEMCSPAYFERLRLAAVDRRARYASNLAAGFTEAQALELVK